MLNTAATSTLVKPLTTAELGEILGDLAFESALSHEADVYSDGYGIAGADARYL